MTSADFVRRAPVLPLAFIMGFARRGLGRNRLDRVGYGQARECAFQRQDTETGDI